MSKEPRPLPPKDPNKPERVRGISPPPPTKKVDRVVMAADGFALVADDSYMETGSRQKYITLPTQMSLPADSVHNGELESVCFRLNCLIDAGFCYVRVNSRRLERVAKARVLSRGWEANSIYVQGVSPDCYYLSSMFPLCNSEGVLACDADLAHKVDREVGDTTHSTCKRCGKSLMLGEPQSVNLATGEAIAHVERHTDFDCLEYRVSLIEDQLKKVPSSLG